MTPEQYIKKSIIRDVSRWETKFSDEPSNTPSEIDAVYQQIVDEGYHWDSKSEMRSGEIETNIKPESSRYCLTKSVAMKIDNVWIGWDFLYAGGKHFDGNEYDWMEDAYFLELVKEEEKVIIERTFKKI